MEHICKNCIHSYGWGRNGISYAGNCQKLKELKQQSGEIPKDFISTDGKDEQGNPIRDGSIMATERGVCVSEEHGKDCEYFSLKWRHKK